MAKCRWILSLNFTKIHHFFAGSKVRKIPFPTGNPLTCLFNVVSCPNYTYEISAWIAFSIMTQCLPAGIFTLAGAYQMTIWALGKHRNYKKEFEKYPRGRRAIIPFILWMIELKKYSPMQIKWSLIWHLSQHNYSTTLTYLINLSNYFPLGHSITTWTRGGREGGSQMSTLLHKSY